MKPSPSLFDRFIGRPRPLRVTLLVIVLLFMAPIVAAYMDGTLVELTSGSGWRGVLVPAIIISYILLVAPRLGRNEVQIIDSLRPIMLIDDEELEQLVREVTIKPRTEIIAIVVGIVLGLLMIVASLEASLSWLVLVFYISSILMYGLLLWTIYISLASTRLTNMLLKQPLRVDPFDISPFEAIGLQSLLLALVFVGGITLSLIFIIFGAENILLKLEFWLVYLPLALVPIVVFFLNMYPTHRVLATAKAQELGVVRRHLHRTFRALLEGLDNAEDTTSIAAEINALATYEQQLEITRTWPYNTGMLRTLFFSILVPAAAVLGRIIAEVAFN